MVRTEENATYAGLDDGDKFSPGTTSNISSSSTGSVGGDKKKKDGCIWITLRKDFYAAFGKSIDVAMLAVLVMEHFIIYFNYLNRVA